MLDFLLRGASEMTIDQVANDCAPEEDGGGAYEYRAYLNGVHQVSGVDIVSFEALGHSS